MNGFAGAKIRQKDENRVLGMQKKAEKVVRMEKNRYLCRIKTACSAESMTRAGHFCNCSASIGELIHSYIKFKTT